MLRFFLLLVVIGLAVLGFAWQDYNKAISAPLHITDDNREFTIERGWSAKRVAEALKEKQLIEKPHWFYLYTRLQNKGGSIKSGEFILNGAPDVPELLDIFIKGQTKQYTGQIIEGSNFKQVRARIAQNSDLKQTLGELSDAQIMQALESEYAHPEGLFFADTYSFPKNTSDLQFLERAYNTMQSVLQEEWDARDPDLPLKSPYEALILASIVEKETAVAAERPLIAGVFVSRLRIKMRLQTDPTVIYGMGERYDGNIRRSDLTTDTPYNTYTRAGLPPTPIATVGREAINAVMHPTPTPYLYFVAKGDGTHQFSKTLDEHNAAVRKYQLKR